MRISDFLPPPVSFYFSVVFMSVPQFFDISFMEVSGLSTELVTEELKEGGENSFSYQLPTRIKHGNLILKRPVGSAILDPLESWVADALGGEFVASVHPIDISIYLKDALGIPMRFWYVTNAYPVKWESSQFSSNKNELALETLELAYHKIERIL